ncbi:hypothetical protein [Corallococcus sp. Z5C101001]|uniref:hypothetical protein n=1 Tax=Corallococcus sp. Z5C101001 TaxID=2596829 RepID=UPI00117DB53D|nr:hypothetical protein [Corallococcus sp. Z5C101001]TSC21540.1 hypothetical protein FOF48_34290 [Corallococcus sp. Z5C101001]
MTHAVKLAGWETLVGLWLACGQTPPYDASLGLLSPPTSVCLPMTCESQGLDCGYAIDGCGGTLHCGTCDDGLTCGGGGEPNVCAAPP